MDCDCDTDHEWWMTIKIGDLKKVIEQIHTAREQAWHLVHQSDDVAVSNVISILQSSQGILDSVIDDMKSEGGRATR